MRWSIYQTWKHTFGKLIILTLNMKGGITALEFFSYLDYIYMSVTVFSLAIEIIVETVIPSGLGLGQQLTSKKAATFFNSEGKLF